MSKFITIMDMKFVDGTQPDFGSIRMVDKKPHNVRQYVLLNADIDKLNQITNCRSGSTAYTTDTNILLMYEETSNEWYEVQ